MSFLCNMPYNADWIPHFISFEHEVINDSDKDRVVLLMRLWHPELLQEQQRSDALVQAINKKEKSVTKRYHPS